MNVFLICKPYGESKAGATPNLGSSGTSKAAGAGRRRCFMGSFETTGREVSKVGIAPVTYAIFFNRR